MLALFFHLTDIMIMKDDVNIFIISIVQMYIFNPQKLFISRGDQSF